MDCRSASLILVAALTGTGSIRAGTIATSLNQGITNGADQAVGQFVGHMLANDNQVVRVVGTDDLLASSDQHVEKVIVGELEFAFDGSSISDQLSVERHNDGAFGGSWNVRVAPPQGVFSDAGGLANPNNVPLPAPVAMGGVGLLSLAGFATWKRRARG